MMRYADFDLWIERNSEGEGYWVRANAGGRSEWLTFERPPFTEDELQGLWGAVGRNRDVRVRSRGRVTAPVRELGRRFFEAVFSGPVRDLFNEHLPGRMSGKGLRLRLRAGTSEIAGWPWELLHSPKEPLALAVRTPVVRQVDQVSPLPALRTTWPLRVLVVIAEPHGCEPLEGERELAEVRNAPGWLVKLGVVRIERLEPPTLAALEDRLFKGPPVHVLHFIGHGTFAAQTGALIFEDARGHPDPVPGETLAILLDGIPALRLVVLNACHGARAGINRYSGVAQSLLRKKIPAVVAMRDVIRDDLAVAFSRRFYTALVRGRAVDWAVTMARKAVLAAGGDPEWAIPLLFLSAEDGRLFRWRPSKGFFAALAVIVLLVLSYRTWHWRLTSALPLPACESPRALPDLKLVPVRGGRFLMGSGADDEKPVHRVTISRPFCLGAHEVTRQEWETVVGPLEDHGDPGDGALPVMGIRYTGAQDFLRRLNQRQGEDVFRLPTEAEWEFAAQDTGGSNCGTDVVARAGSLSPSRLGLYDMLGNAWEWVEDRYGPYPSGPVTDPKGPPAGEERIRRGGAFDYATKNCRITQRSHLKPSARYRSTGFRILREIR